MKFNSFIALLALFISCGVESGASQVVEQKTNNKINDDKCQKLISAA